MIKHNNKTIWSKHTKVFASTNRFWDGRGHRTQNAIYLPYQNKVSSNTIETVAYLRLSSIVVEATTK